MVGLNGNWRMFVLSLFILIHLRSDSCSNVLPKWEPLQITARILVTSPLLPAAAAPIRGSLLARSSQSAVLYSRRKAVLDSSRFLPPSPRAKEEV